MFVNPLPDLRAKDLLQFDFPADCRAHGTLPNINIAAPGIEEMYGKLGTPPKQQGHPVMKEYRPEDEDPHYFPYQDQIIDIDRKAEIYHTGRLSGVLAKFLARDEYESQIRFDALPLTTGGGPISIDTIVRSLDAEPEAANVWYFKDHTCRELLFTAKVNFDPKAVGLKAGNLYKLTIRWEFWNKGKKYRVRMPISGFDETVAFEVSAPTVDL
jgi:hypothetical protein